MVRAAEWIVSRGNDKREFTAHYLEDPPKRSEAIEFFSAVDGHLFANCPVTDELWAMSVPGANAYLAANPIPETFEALYLDQNTNVTDDDLRRLAQLPELIRFRVTSKQISDAGVCDIVSALPRLEELGVYSRRLTDACLDAIASLKSLRVLSLQAESQITIDAFNELIARMPHIIDSYGPPS